MDYWFAVATPATTAKENAVTTELKLCEGVIVKVWMLHPEGCHGLAYAAIFHEGSQLYPINPEEGYHGNDVPMEWADNFQLRAPALLKLKTWNLDDTYEHKVFVRVTLLRPEEDPTLLAMLQIWENIRQLLMGRRIS